MARAFCCLLAVALLSLGLPAAAQLAPAKDDPVAAPATVSDPLGRDTPRGAVTGLLRALAQRDYERAGLYLKPSEIEIRELRAAKEAEASAIAAAAEQAADEGPKAGGNKDAASDPGASPDADIQSPATSDTELPLELSERALLARSFQVLLDRAGSLSEFTALSNRPEGAMDDGYPADLEQVGLFRGEQPIPILFARDADEATGQPIWRLSRQTISDFERVVPPEVQQVLIEAVERAEPALLFRGAPLTDWLQLLAIAFLCFFSLYLVAQGALFGLRKAIAVPERSRLYRAIFTVLPPLCLLLAVAAFQIITNRIEISIVAQQALLRYNGILGWVAVLWFGMRVVDSFARAATVRLEERQARQSRSVIALVERTAKLVIFAFGAFVILDALGFDVTTGIAALGIGGLAFALGAQKTIENLVGSVTVIADKPVQIGDLCKVGGVTGTVEDIGIRSTRIRTLERTLVSIPNAELASQQIENYSARDRFLFAPVIALEPSAAPFEIDAAIAIIENVLNANPQIDRESCRVLLSELGKGSLDIKIHGYIRVSDFLQAEHVRHALLHAIYAQFHDQGLRLAGPDESVRLAFARSEAALETNCIGAPQ